MASHGLRDQDRLDSVSKFFIWRARILSFLDEYGIKNNAENVLAKPTDPDPLNKFNENQVWAKHLIMEGVKDHVVPHISRKKMENEMWTDLKAMYQGNSIQWKILLENQMRLFRMQKGEEVDPFVFYLKTI